MQSFHQFVLLNEAEERVYNTLRNLMALADRPGTPQEGIAAREHAERLAAKHGINLASLTAPEPAPTPQRAPQRAHQSAPQADPRNEAPPTSQIVPEEFLKLFRQFGWVRDRRPYIAFVKPGVPELRDHVIVMEGDGWQHLISGNPRYAGRTSRELLHHLNYYF